MKIPLFALYAVPHTHADTLTWVGNFYIVIKKKLLVIK